MIIKVMTYNIQHGLDYELRLKSIRKVDLIKISKVIKENDPDIVCFNEIYNTNNEIEQNNEYFKQIVYLASINNYPYYLFSKAINTKNGPYGNAIMSKIKFNSYEINNIVDPIIKDEKVFYESRVLTKFNFDNFDLINSHFGLAKSEQRNAYDCLINKVDKNHKTIFVGDLNMEPDNEIIKNISNYFIDSTINYNHKIDFTFPSINPIKKIDYIFITKDIKIIDSHVINYVSSDHLPIISILDI